MRTLFLLLWFGPAEEHYKRGVDLFNQGRFPEAATALEAAVRAEAENAQAWKALGVAYAAQGDHALAEEPFERACRISPKLEDACYFYARNQYAQNRFERSLAALKLAEAVDSRPSRIHLGRAQALEALGRGKEAEQAFQVAIRLNSGAKPDDDPRVHYAVFLFRQGRAQEAISPLEALIAQHGTAPRPRFELGRVLYQLGRYEEAAGQFERAVTLGYGEQARIMLAKARALRDTARP